MALSCRMHEEADLPALRALWQAETEWGTITDEMWRRHVLDHPCGGAAIVVATDDASGDIVGEFTFLPTRVWTQGREVRAYRPSAPVVAKAARGSFSRRLRHPVIAMYQHAVLALRAQGHGVLYMMPDPRWIPFLSLFPNMVAGRFPLWQMPVPLAAPLSLSAGAVAVPVAPDDERVDALWEVTRAQYRSAVVRDAEALRWRFGAGDHTVLGVERGGELTGLVSARAKGDRQWLICDVMAADDVALRDVLSAAVNLGHEAALADGSPRAVRKAAVLVTPRMEPAARALGFVRDAYDFPMLVHILDRSISKDDLDPAHWYVSAND